STAGDQLMVITTIGRTSGRSFSRPIGYLRDNYTLLALTIGGRSNWYKNLLKKPVVTLEIKGERLLARAVPVHDQAERQAIFELYKRERAGSFERYFGVPADAPPDALAQALATREFVRFHFLG